MDFSSNKLICLTLHSFQIGGCELQLLSLLKSLTTHGIDVLVIHGNVKGSFRPHATNSVKFISIPQFIHRSQLISFYLGYLFRWKIKRLPTVFHCHVISDFTDQILRFAHRKKINALLKIAAEGEVSELKDLIQKRPTFFQMLQLAFSKESFLKKRTALKNFLFGKKRLETFTKVKGFLSINTNIKTELEQFPVEKKKIISIHNGVDTDRFHPVSDAEKMDLKRELHLPSDFRFVTMIARFVDRKRFEDLILAWSHVGKFFPDYKLLLVGDGPKRKTYQTLISQLGIENLVLLTGFQLQIEKFFQVSELFAFTSELEGLPNVLLEAMSCQLPIVGSDISGIREIITPFQNGLLYPPKNVQALTESLLYLLKHPKEAQKMAVDARETMIKGYSFKRTTPMFVSLYQKFSTNPSGKQVANK